MSDVKVIDNALDEYIKGQSDESFVTGWILVASLSSHTHEAGLTDGYVTVTSDGLPHHVQIGLLTVAQQDKQSMAMVASMASMMGAGDWEEEDE